MPICSSSASGGGGVVDVNFSLKSWFSQKRLDDNSFPILVYSFLRKVPIWIWLNRPKGHFKGLKGRIWLIFHLGDNFLKNCLITFFYLGIEVPKMGADGLPKDGFDWIALKVIFQDPKKVKFDCFATLRHMLWNIYIKLYLIFQFTLR